MTYFDLSKLNIAKANVLKAFESYSKGNRRDEVALRTACNKNIKFRIIKIRTSCHGGYFYYSENLNWAACCPRVGHSWTRMSFLRFGKPPGPQRALKVWGANKFLRQDFCFYYVLIHNFLGTTNLGGTASECPSWLRACKPPNVMFKNEQKQRI